MTRLFRVGVFACAACGPLGNVKPITDEGPADTRDAGTMPEIEPPDWTAPGLAPTGENTPEDSGRSCPLPVSLPAYSALAPTEKLPDPFLGFDGERIDSVADWTCRRAEIAQLVQEYELGPKPSKPENVTGSFADGAITVSISEGDAAIDFSARITLPEAGAAPYPAMIAIGGSSLDNTRLAEAGVALVTFPNDELGEQQGGGSRGRGKFYDFYGTSHPAGAMMAWAWGVSRLIDALERTPEAAIDASRLGVTGCSRNGKGALVAGAFDERIKLTIPQESGAGGSALWRLADVHHAAWVAGGAPGQDVQTLAQIVMENVWFRSSFSQFSRTATHLPFDHHLVMALVAPRAMFVVNNTSQYWLDREGSHAGAATAHLVWDALGLSDVMGSSQLGGHNHCQNVPRVQLDEISAYVDKFLVGGGAANTEVLYSDAGYELDRERWIDWEVPTLTD